MKTIDPPAGGDPAGFDPRARELYRQSLGQLPPAVHARLRAARRHALDTRRAARLPRWLPGGLAATLVLAMVAVTGLREPAEPAPEPAIANAPVPAPAPPDPGALALTDPELALALESLDHTPDFYLWLAANDDTLPATEY